MHIARSLSLLSLLATWLVAFALAYPVVPPASRAIRAPREHIESIHAGAALPRRVDALDDLEARDLKRKLLAPVKKALKKLNPANILKPNPKHSPETGFDHTAFGGVPWRPAQDHAGPPHSPHSENIVYGVAYEPRPLPLQPQAPPSPPAHAAEPLVKEAVPASRVKGPRPKPWRETAQ